MFCPECGKEVSDQKKFCIHCGASIVSQQPSSAAPSAAAQAAAQQPKKSKKSIWVILAIIAIAAILGSVIGNLMGGSMAEDLKNDSGSASSQSTTTAPVDTGAIGGENSSGSSSATSYSSIFSERNIVRMDTTFYGLESAAFAKVDSDGNVNCVEYGYKDDIVHTYVETVYVDISAYTDEQKADFDTGIRAYYADYESLSYFSVSYQMGSNFYTISVRMNDLNQPSNLHDAVAQGLLQLDGEGDYMSFRATEQNMLLQGFLKK